MVGLGLNYHELARNEACNAFVIHDLNKDPDLPFDDRTFDVILNTVSVDYMTRPFEIFADVGRVLKPGGLFLVTFSNRMFETKATKIWRQSSEEERVILVEDLFEKTGLFTKPEVFVSKNKPRPTEDKYAHLGIPSDPVYAVYAERIGGGISFRPRKLDEIDEMPLPQPGLIRNKMAAVGRSRCCPYCESPLRKWEVPNNPFIEWDVDFMYICFNDRCPYFQRGWNAMYRGGGRGFSHRFMYDASHDRCLSVPVPTAQALKDGIVD
jgi:SAM-dependent methyltransferase